MPYQSVSSRFTYIGSPDQVTQFENAIRAVYDGSAGLRQSVNSWLASHSNQNIIIAFEANKAYAPVSLATGGLGQIFIDPAYAADLTYLSTMGKAANSTLESVVVHELGHAVGGKLDNDSFANLSGDNVNQVQPWLKQLGYDTRSSYNAIERNGGLLKIGVDYTDGKPIANSILDIGTYDNRAAGGLFIQDTGNIDLTASGVKGSTLIIGGVSDNNYTGTASNDWIYGGAGDDTIRGGQGNDIIYGDDRFDFTLIGDDFLYGDGGNDRLVGGPGRDEIRGGTGNDTIYGDYGVNGPTDGTAGLFNDRLFGDEGADLINGQQGDDFIDGGTGNDTLSGNDGNDMIRGGAGNDLISGDGGNDVAYGDAGDDTIYGSDGEDILFGGTGKDKLYGDFGPDTLDGGDQDDILDGGGDNDYLIGGAGNDVLNSGSGSGNTLEGGAGNDRLFFYDGGGFAQGGIGNDVISIGNQRVVVSMAAKDGYDALTGNISNAQIRIDAPLATFQLRWDATLIDTIPYDTYDEFEHPITLYTYKYSGNMALLDSTGANGIFLGDISGLIGPGLKTLDQISVDMRTKLVNFTSMVSELSIGGIGDFFNGDIPQNRINLVIAPVSPPTGLLAAAPTAASIAVQSNPWEAWLADAHVRADYEDNFATHVFDAMADYMFA
jgi:Ca2+-binding RTX toxin-like protein